MGIVGKFSCENSSFDVIDTKLNNLSVVNIKTKNKVSVENLSLTTIDSITFDIGTYIVTASIEFLLENASSYRILIFSTIRSGSYDHSNSVTSKGDGVYTTLSRSFLLEVTSPTTYYLMTKHSIGETVTVNGEIRFIKIK